MRFSTNGYIFTARMDCYGAVGVVNVLKNTGKTVSIVTGVNSSGLLADLQFNDSRDGFTYITDDNLDCFLRSNRSIYSVVGDAVYFVEYRKELDTERTGLSIYIPKYNMSYGKDFCVVCNKITTEKVMNCMIVSKKLYSMLESSILSQFDRFVLTDRSSYIHSRIMKGVDS